MKAGILTISDRCSAGVRDDLSGPALAEVMLAQGIEIIYSGIVPDERNTISSALKDISEVAGVDLILTTGGTGFAPRDVTPEATMDIIDKVVPGIPEMMRKKSMEITPNAMLSRAAAGIRGKTLIVNLPGSPKAAVECLNVILPVLPHAIKLIKGNVSDCALENK